ncbi:MAG: dUTP diphosphatase [Pseudomonadota bacterium]
MSDQAVLVQRLDHAHDLPLPEYATSEAAGLDLRAAVPVSQPETIRPGERALIPTGLQIELPKGFEAQVRPRSGLAFKHGVTVLNSPGTIDSDYRGELKVLLINHGHEPFAVERGMRVAQMVIAPVVQVTLQSVEALSVSERGEGGYGSTGTG